MFFRDSPEKFFNLLAAKYAASPISDVVAYQSKIERLKTYLSAENYVLDMGCGTGTQCCDLANDVTQVIGVDISSKLLAIANQRRDERNIENVEFIETTIFDERFEPGSFDVVMAFYVLHFCDDLDEAISRIHGLLKPDGLFILETACLGEINKIMAAILRIAGKFGFLPYINQLTTGKIEQSLEQAGFSIVEKTRFSEAGGEYTLIAKKW